MTDRSCESYKELASAFADDRLNSGEIITFQEHLSGCAGCRRFLNDIYRVRDLLVAAEVRHAPLESSPAFAAAVSKKIGSQPRFILRKRAASIYTGLGWARLSGAAAAALLLLSVGWSWYRLSLHESGVRLANVQPAALASDEGSMVSYYRQHALQRMDSTFLGSSEGIELASFDTFGNEKR